VTALRTRLEDGVIAALTPLKAPALGGALGGYLHTLAAYNGELEGRQFEDVKGALRQGAPAVLVFTTDGEYDAIDIRRRKATARIRVELLAVSANYRGREERTRGDGGANDPGLYQLVEDVRNRLQGNDLDVAGAGPLTPVNEKVHAQRPDLCVWRLAYSVDADAFAPELDVADPAVTLVHGDVILPAADSDVADSESGTGDDLAFSGGVVTLHDAGASFDPEHVGRVLRLAGATTATNNGSFLVGSVPDATHLTFANALGATEAFAGTWKIKPLPLVQVES